MSHTHNRSESDGTTLQRFGATLSATPMITSVAIAGVSVSAGSVAAQQGSNTQDILYRVNAGGPSLTVSGGPDWTADSATDPSQYRGSDDTELSDFSENINSTTDAVPDGTPIEVFTNSQCDPETDGAMQWDFSVEAGTEVDVRLYLAEPYVGAPGGAPSQPGERQFNVSIEGEQVLSNYDMYADVGFGNGTVKTFNVTSDGTIDVDLEDGEANNPIISGIEIVQNESSGSGTEQ